MIREYSFLCNKCSYEFSQSYDWNKVKKPRCPMCKTNKQVYRNFGAENVIIDDNVPKTLGALADKNSKSKGIIIDGEK